MSGSCDPAEQGHQLTESAWTEEPNRRGCRMSLQFAILVVTSGMVPVTGCHTSRIIDRDLSDIRGVMTLNTAEQRYYEKFGKYAETLAELGPGSADLISGDLASGQIDSYIFSVRGTPNGYQITVKTDGSHADSRTFYSDQTQIIRENHGREPATAQSEVIR